LPSPSALADNVVQNLDFSALINLQHENRGWYGVRSIVASVWHVVAKVGGLACL
jgi:hypothetical protein